MWWSGQSPNRYHIRISFPGKGLFQHPAKLQTDWGLKTRRPGSLWPPCLARHRKEVRQRGASSRRSRACQRPGRGVPGACQRSTRGASLAEALRGFLTPHETGARNEMRGEGPAARMPALPPECFGTRRRVLRCGRSAGHLAWAIGRRHPRLRHKGSSSSLLDWDAQVTGVRAGE